MNILYVSQYFPPEMGAPAARAAELAQHWAGAGHDVSILTGFPNHPTGVVPHEWRSRLHRLAYREKTGRIEVFRTWLWPLPNRKAHERMRNYASFCLSAGLRGLGIPRPDVIIATSPQLLGGLSGWWLSCAKRVPFVFEVRDLWPESLIAVGAGVLLIPGFPLIRMMILSQVVNGIVLPFVLVFMLLLINDRELMGEHVNSRFFNVVAWATAGVMIVLTIAMLFTQ